MKHPTNKKTTHRKAGRKRPQKITANKRLGSQAKRKNSGPAEPSRPTVKRLFATSGNRCAFPGCHSPLVDPQSGSIIGVICHIKGEKPGSPRYDKQQSDEERQGFMNLMLMDGPHHKVIDDDEKNYTAERLLEIKNNHEAAQPKGPSLTNEQVDQLIRNISGNTLTGGSILQTQNQSGGQVAHTIHNYHQREEAKKEEVRVNLGVMVPGGLYVDIYNSGQIPVYIKEVALGRDLDDDTTMRTPLLVATAMPVTDGKGSVAYVVLGEKSYDLTARKEVRFVLPRFPSSFIQVMATCPQEKVWLSVNTYGGEIHRLRGDQVQPDLAELEKLYRGMEEAEKPKVMKVRFYTQAEGSTLKEIGMITVHLAKPGGIGPFQVRFEPESGFSLSYQDGQRLAEELANNKVIGRLGNYEWRVES